MKAVVAGAGILGRMTAWRLLRAGWSVDLVDPSPEGVDRSAAWVAAGMLAPWCEAASGQEELVQDGIAGLRRWGAWLPELEADSGHVVPFNTAGTVVLAHRHDAGLIGPFKARLNALEEIRCHALDRSQLEQRLPGLAGGFSEGLWVESESVLDNRAVLSALDAAITRLGGRRLCAIVTTLTAQRVLLQSGDAISCDQSFDCRGLGARESLPGLRGVRGEILRVHAPEVDFGATVRLLHPRYRLYISPRPQRRFVVGATEIESEDNRPVTVRSTLELLSALYAVHSGFAEATIEAADARCRPAMEDNLPRVQHEQGAAIALNGAFRHGFLLAPVLVGRALDLSPAISPGRVAV